MAAAAILCAVAVTSCKKEQAARSAGSYETAQVTTTSRTLSKHYSSTIRGRQDIEIYPQVGGTLQQLCVSEGQAVKKGQTLFIRDQVPYQAALNTAEANLRAAKANEATAELTYSSTKRLFDQNVVSEYDLQKAENTLLSAKATVAQMEAQVVNARNSLSYTVVKSPADGVVGELPYRQGALVGSAMPKPLTTVSDNHDMYVYFSMNENELLSMVRQYGNVAEAIKNMPPVALKLSDGSLLPDSGRVESISGVIDTSTGSVQVRAAFSNRSNLLHSGSNGNVVIPVEYKDILVIPQSATMKRQDQVLVYQVVEDKSKNAFVGVQRKVQVAPINDGKEYIVLEGLNNGDEIVKDGVGLLRGDSVIVRSIN